MANENHGGLATPVHMEKKQDATVIWHKAASPPSTDRICQMASTWTLVYYYNYNHLTASFPGQPG